MATPEDLRIQEEINRLEKERAGISQDNLERQQNISNFLQQQLNLLRFEKAEKAEIRSLTRQLNKIAAESAAITLDELGSAKSLAKIQKDRQKVDQNLTRLVNQRNKFANQEGKANKIITEALDDQIDQLLEINAELSEAERTSRAVAENFGVRLFRNLEGVAGQLERLTGLQLKQAFTDAANASRTARLEGGKFFKVLKAGASALGGAAIKGAFALVLNSVLSINKAQTEFRRLTGEAATEVGLLNDGLLTSVDLIQTQVALTEQFGLNARAAFGNETLQVVGELIKAVGLTAEEAGSLARFSTIAEENLNSQLDSLTKSVPKAFSQKQILRETANVSNDIALAFGNSAYEIGQSVIAAKQLGLSLQDVNGIADNLLDIESSIASEFEAEVITGRQLNFERARLFALTNELGKLTEEIKGNEEIINEFAGATRIEQEAIAKAFGMSRQQMADMVMSSKLINTLSDEQRANAAGISLEQLNQLDIQQSIQTSISKITQALAGPLEGFAQLIQYVTKFSGLIAGGVAGLVAFKGVNAAIIAQEKIKVALAGTQSLRAAALAAIKTIGNPLALAGGLAAGIAAYAAAKTYINKAGDAIIPSSGGPIISTREGGLIQGTKNDEIIMAPGIARGGRNSGEIILSDAQINRIANAVRDGASRATINLDGDRVSSRLQTPGVINQRQYSI